MELKKTKVIHFQVTAFSCTVSCNNVTDWSSFLALPHYILCESDLCWFLFFLIFSFIGNSSQVCFLKISKIDHLSPLLCNYIYLDPHILPTWTLSEASYWISCLLFFLYSLFPIQQMERCTQNMYSSAQTLMASISKERSKSLVWPIETYVTGLWLLFYSHLLTLSCFTLHQIQDFLGDLLKHVKHIHTSEYWHFLSFSQDSSTCRYLNELPPYCIQEFTKIHFIMYLYIFAFIMCYKVYICVSILIILYTIK